VDLYGEKFHWRREKVFNGQTYTDFLDQIAESHPRRKKIYLVHDNAAHHKSEEVRDWLARHGHRFHLEHLPPYSPEFNATERIWHYMRIQATHNRYYADETEFVLSLESSLQKIQSNPHLVSGYLQPFL